MPVQGAACCAGPLFPWGTVESVMTRWPGDGPLLVVPVGGEQRDFLDELRQEFGVHCLATMGPGSDACLLGQAVEEREQVPESDESALSWAATDASGVESVVADLKSFPRSTP